MVSLIGVTELARMLGLSGADTWRLAHSPGFPSAAAEHDARPLWSTKAIEEWLAGREAHANWLEERSRAPAGTWREPRRVTLEDALDPVGQRPE
jgi:hypothetical protein